MKFVTACQISRWEADIWGFPPTHKKQKQKCRNCQLFHPAGANPSPDGEIRKVYAGNRSTEVLNTWCDSVGKLGIYWQKPAIGPVVSELETRNFSFGGMPHHVFSGFYRLSYSSVVSAPFSHHYLMSSIDFYVLYASLDIV